MKNIKTIVAAFLELLVFAGCTALVLFFTLEGGPGAGLFGKDPFAGTGLNRDLLSLLGSDNSVLRESDYGRCYARMTQRGTARLTYFSPYLSVQFAPREDSQDVWLEGDSEGFYDENPFADDLSIVQIDLCEEIDPQVPSIEQQISLRQLINTSEPITYALLCEKLGQTPELKHRSNAYYDPVAVTEGGSYAQKNYRIGQRITGGVEMAVFRVGDVKLQMSFIKAEDEYLAIFARVEKTD